MRTRIIKTSGYLKNAVVKAFDDGYIKKNGEMLVVGYKSANDKHYYLAVPIDEIKKLLEGVEK